jgi:dolichyl-diphosphooligosaccharide--protein glycosyltransferase
MQIPTYDAYFDFPRGFDYSSLPPSYNAYGIFIAVLAWIVSLGHPTKEIVSVVSAIHPAVLGILALIPIFFITRKITKNDYVASGAIFLGSVIPGEYMGRAMLGATDTHCLEIFLFAYIMMFTVFSLNDGKWKFLWIGLTAVFYTAYLLIWQGAVIYGLFMAIFGILWLIGSRIKGNPDYKNAITISAILGSTIVFYLAMTSFSLTSIHMLFTPLLGIVIILIYTFITKRAKNWIYLLPLGIIALGIVGLVVSLKFVGYYFYPTWLNGIINQVYNLVAWHTQSTTAEELPLLITLGTVSTEIPWIYFGLPWYLTFVGIGVLAYQAFKRNDMNLFFLLLWTVCMLIPELAMRRFAYYFAVNVIIVSAWVVYLVLKTLWNKEKLHA